MIDSPYSTKVRPWQRWITIALAVAILPLVLVGATVTSTDSGMAFPDWPTSDGALVNPAGWTTQFHTFWEHLHRLIGWSVGMLAIAAVTVTFLYERSWRVRLLSIWVLLAIIAQGIMGGIRVIEISTTWALIHGCWAQVCFGSAVALAVYSSLRQSGVIEDHRPISLGMLACTLAGLVFVYIQIVWGALLRHLDRFIELHVAWGIITSFTVAAASIWVLQERRHTGWLRRPALLAAVLIWFEVLLGFTSRIALTGGEGQGWSTAWSAVAPTAHVVMGSIIFACMVILCVVMMRIGPAAALPADEKGMLPSDGVTT
jgi:cytochrome c oxidase assembly protein subunit 15